MIFAEIENDQHYSEFYEELLGCIREHYPNVESGIQGDAWIWIFEHGEKVAVDTFSSMRFQIKSDKGDGELIKSLINAIGEMYSVLIYDLPKLESHEDIEISD